MNVSSAISHGVHGLQVGRERVTHYDIIGSGLVCHNAFRARSTIMVFNMMCRALDAGFLIITHHVPAGCTRRVTIIFIAELSIINRAIHV